MLTKPVLFETLLIISLLTNYESDINMISYLFLSNA